MCARLIAGCRLRKCSRSRSTLTNFEQSLNASRWPNCDLAIDPKEDRWQKNSKCQANRRHQWLPAESIRHDHSDDCGNYESDRGREHEVTKRCPASYVLRRKMRVFVNHGQLCKHARRLVTV